MSDVVFALYFDPAELDPRTEEPAYLLGLFSTRAGAEEALTTVAGGNLDPRWMVIEETLDERGWLDGFVTVRWHEVDHDEPGRPTSAG